VNSFCPSDVAAWTGGAWLDERKGEKINGFAFDARLIEPGQCFIALRSDRRDGHDYIGQALQRGALAAMVERPIESELPQLVVKNTLDAMEAIAIAVRDRYPGQVIGVTGSCGKTSTKEMLTQLLGRAVTHATEGNWNNRIGVPMTLFRLHSNEKSFAVVEAGINQPEEMGHLGAMIQANLVLVTNIGPAHLEKLSSLEGIAAEKACLMERASSDAQLILPADVFRYTSFARFADRATVLIKEGESVIGQPQRVVRYGIEGGKICIEELFGQTLFSVASRSPGIRANAALALVAADSLGIPVDLLEERLAAWSPSGNRGRLVDQSGRPCYMDCYNANPASMADALSAFTESVSAALPRCYVLGAMQELGSRAPDLHAQSLQGLILRPGDVACLVGPEELRAGYRRGLTASAEQIYEADSAEEIQSIVASFQGALFLKGSRIFALEQLLPEITE
jgi:UDP-N-acetylmuramoyl-tripeptide--D-alanyl-D-alanine ligase